MDRTGESGKPRQVGMASRPRLDSVEPSCLRDERQISNSGLGLMSVPTPGHARTRHEHADDNHADERHGSVTKATPARMLAG